MCVRPSSSCGSSSTVHDDDDFGEDEFPPAPTAGWRFGQLREVLHSAVDDLRAVHELPPVRASTAVQHLVDGGRRHGALGGAGVSTCGRCCGVGGVEPVVMSMTSTPDGWVTVCGDCSRSAGEEERWNGWLPW